mmetsp:Transcript_11784/g.27677  ORF Transcript_11784/g.27677 Transcript_11784/m.27677 type:complete len:359 (+) Transcript_11784:2229-3305(+)
MKAATAAKPQVTLAMPFSMFSLPKLGPMVRSSMISIGAANEPARSSRAVSLASWVVIAPLIWKRLPSSELILGAVTTSPLPFSNSRMAMRLPMFSREVSFMTRAPLASTVRCTAGLWFSSKPGWASLRLSPVRMTWRLTMIGPKPRSMKRSVPKGTGPLPLSASSASALSSTMRSSSVAVRPMMSLALAVSCTPGSCTTTRSRPCCWIVGSDTPSSLTRLCSVVMFCLMAASCTAVWAWGDRLPASCSPPSPSCGVQTTSGSWLRSSATAAVRCSASRNATSTLLASRVMPAWRRFFSRSSERTSPVSASAFLVRAAFMSTCIRKCTPPRRSRPRYIGLACRAESHCGERDSRFSATI